MREIHYIEGTEAKITVNDGIFVDLERFEGREVLLGLEPRRLFPVSGRQKYITLLDKEGVEQAVVRDMRALLPESRAALEQSLAEYYRIPVIQRFLKMDTRGIWAWTVETDRGIHTFELGNLTEALKQLYDGRILIKDRKDNRYEIPDVKALDPESRRLLAPNL